MKAEVEQCEDNNILINYSELAKKYNVVKQNRQLASNGGQIVKEWLISDGVDVSHFATKRKNDGNPVVRRKKRKGQGGEISVPVEDQQTLKKQAEG
jgi:hypothetical protein